MNNKPIRNTRLTHPECHQNSNVTNPENNGFNEKLEMDYAYFLGPVTSPMPLFMKVMKYSGQDAHCNNQNDGGVISFEINVTGPEGGAITCENVPIGTFPNPYSKDLEFKITGDGGKERKGTVLAPDIGGDT